MIEEIKQRLSIISLLNYLGIEPNKQGFIKSIYKQENTPSLKIYSETNSYYDFAVNKGGDVIKFYQDFYGKDTKQAIDELALMCGISRTHCQSFLQGFNLQTNNKRVIKFKILKSEKYFFDERAGIYEFEAGLTQEEATKYAFQDLTNQRKDLQISLYESLYSYCGLDNQAYEYLISNKRKLNVESIARFKIFSLKPDSETFLMDNYIQDELLISGLFNERGNFIFNNHRLIIPYIENGQVAYLRGRYFRDANYTPPKGIGKYISLNNFAGNLTSKRFFNIDTLKERTQKQLILAEGEFDTIITEQCGAKAVGIPGVSNFPTNKIHLLNNYDIYLAFDNDPPGFKATKEISKYFNKNIYALKIKNGKDLTEIL